MITHSDETPYRCTTCNKCFKWKTGLTKHMKIHSNENLHTSCDPSKHKHIKTAKLHVDQHQPPNDAPSHNYLDSCSYASDQTALHTSDDPFVISVKTEDDNWTSTIVHITSIIIFKLAREVVYLMIGNTIV